MKKYKMNKQKSKKQFTYHAGTHPKNNMKPARGGIRA